MKLLFTVLMLLAMFSFAGGQMKNEKSAQNNIEQELLRLENEWLNSYLSGDRQAFDRIVADDFTGTDESGTVRSKTEERDLIQTTPGNSNLSLTLEDVRVRIYKDTAIVTGRIVSKLEASGQSGLNFQSRFTDTFVKRKGRWQVAARHYSRMPRERAVISLDPDVYDAYAGRYEIAPNVVLNIVKEGGKLFNEAAGQPKMELLPESEVEFFIKGINGQFIFVRDEKGQVTKMIINQEGQRITAKRVN